MSEHDGIAGRTARCRQYHSQVHAADAKMVMDLVGCTDTGMEKWAIAYRYDSREAQEVIAASNWESYGHLTLGPAPGPDGNLYDLLIMERRSGISPMEAMVRFRDQAHAADTAKVAALLSREGADLARSTAFRYDTREAFDVLADVNRKAYGHTVLGPAEDDDGQLYGLILFGDPTTATPWLGDPEPEAPVSDWCAETAVHSSVRLPLTGGSGE